MLKPLLMLCLATMLPQLAQAQWNDLWTARSKVSINAQSIAQPLSNVPVAVRLHSGNFNFLDANADGSDIRFIAADDKTELSYQIEKYDAVNELAVIWVQLPRLDAKDKDAHFWLYSGNEKAGAAKSASVWDASTLAALHFSEPSLLQNSALLQNNAGQGMSASGEVALQKAALLGEGALFSGQPLQLSAAAGPSGNDLSFSAWIKPQGLEQQGSEQQALLYAGAMTFKLDGRKLSLSAGNTSVAGGEIKGDAWQHVAFTVQANQATIYVNGVAVANGQLTTAAAAEAKVGQDYRGDMDELQIASVARSADWIKLAASSQGMDSQLLKIEPAGSEEEGGEPNYLSILINSLTIDAKVVIAILAVMFAISLWVMVQKARLVVSTDHDNRRFLARFQQAGNDLLQLDQGASFPHSNLYKLYTAGLREIRKREQDGQTLALSGASMDAIKAAIDADLVRETQRQNAGMVLLTIAISGGPFLGLLGTVVGVMITFAAIAAAGDVNVNAIAPGIAAALLATVAGLAVAIPALFGYNYLASRIKNITIAMQIFVDEFVTRTAELYGK